jgi:hypothetical protein
MIMIKNLETVMFRRHDPITDKFRYQVSLYRPFMTWLLPFFFLILTYNQAAAQKKIEVYLIGGQSNATGQGYMANLSDTMTVNTRVLLFHSGLPHLNSGLPPYTWQPLHQASESPDRFGPELSFGTALKLLRPAATIAIIKHAHSGTNLFNDWNPAKKDEDTLAQGAQYREFIHTVNAGLDSLRKRGYHPVIKGMLWQQGESDADKGGAVSKNYGQNLKHLIGRIRKQLHARNMVFVYGYVYPLPNHGRGIEEVRLAEHDLDQDAGTGLSTRKAYVVNTDSLSLRSNDPNTPYPNDIIHFGTSGTWKLGLRMAYKMNQHL